jgi:hypothetical protein
MGLLFTTPGPPASCPDRVLVSSTRVLVSSTRVLDASAQPPTRVCDSNRSKNAALGVSRPPGGVGDLFCPWQTGDPRHGLPFGACWGFYSKAVFMAWQLTIAVYSRPVARKQLSPPPPQPGGALGACFASKPTQRRSRWGTPGSTDRAITGATKAQARHWFAAGPKKHMPALGAIKHCKAPGT